MPHEKVTNREIELQSSQESVSFFSWNWFLGAVGKVCAANIYLRDLSRNISVEIILIL